MKGKISRKSGALVDALINAAGAYGESTSNEDDMRCDKAEEALVLRIAFLERELNRFRKKMSSIRKSKKK